MNMANLFVFLSFGVLFLVIHGKYQCPGPLLSSCTANIFVTTCGTETPGNNRNTCANICLSQIKKATKICQDNCPSQECTKCIRQAEQVVQDCRYFHKKMESNPSDCNTLERQLIKCCSNANVCKVCQDSFCQNGGVCTGGPNVLSCKCPPGFTGTYCQKSQCDGTHQCANNGTCVGRDTCVCSAEFTGSRCERRKLGTKKTPAPNAKAILEAGDSVGSGLYWIQPPGENKSAQTYCDMEYSDGGWMLASYGFVGSISSSPTNKAIPNMNNPNGFAWLPDKRAGRNGVIDLSQGAVMMARNATFMIMAAGNNPTRGGINQYTFVYRIDLRQNTQQITFANHNRYNGAVGGNGIPKMHVTDFLVEGLKGDVGEYVRYALGESLGVTWADSYPSGYGFNDIGVAFGSWNNGPFFPSIHSGDGHASCSSAPCRTYQPDLSSGDESYAHRGWYTAAGVVNNIGQTSIWFK